MTNEYSSKDLSHHGIVSVICDQIGLVETIDSIIPQDPRSELSTGEVVKLMVINGLGFSSRPLYLESQFFESKPVQRLLGREVDSNQITDDRLGRCLDRCYSNDCNQIFARVATKAAIQYKVDQKFRHLDTTSMSVQGEYDKEEGLGLVQFGYSKDQRSDLKQFMISLMSSKDGDVPLLAQTIAGNSSDKTHFREILSSLKDQMDPDRPFYYIADSALYTQETLKEISSEMKWITRVPEVVSPAKQVIRDIEPERMQSIGNGYSIAEVGNWYGDIQQRWLVVFSEKALSRETKTLEKKVCKELDVKEREFKTLSKEEFSCKRDALRAMDSFQKKLKYHVCVDVNLEEKLVYKSKGRPKKETVPSAVYMVRARLERNASAIELELKRKGRFIIATNELDEGQLPSGELLESYKEQQCVERGFRFLKDPLFMTSSVFLKKEERIVALSMIMCLCLLVYSLAQRLLRQRIQEIDTTVSDQRGKPTIRPTMRWIFQVFEGVHVLFLKEADELKEIVLNLTTERSRILEILGPPFQKIYENAA